MFVINWELFDNTIFSYVDISIGLYLIMLLSLSVITVTL